MMRRAYARGDRAIDEILDPSRPLRLDATLRGIVSLLAAYLPVRRAARTDAASALRAER
jgi:hypothetical protein